jgi:hypothetical protein
MRVKVFLVLVIVGMLETLLLGRSFKVFAG